MRKPLALYLCVEHLPTLTSCFDTRGERLSYSIPVVVNAHSGRELGRILSTVRKNDKLAIVALYRLWNLAQQ